MRQDQFNQAGLTEDQYLRLAEILKEHVNDISTTEFSEYVLRLIENIPRLELVSDSEVSSIINKL